MRGDLVMVEYTDDINVWEEAMPLECPFLRLNHLRSKWVALDEDPCPTKKCGMRDCHNYGKPFHEPDGLIIVKTRKR
ncbi:MAG: hypothetical protein DRJ38_04545 [Thermoprotei archaeon]|nr:MAG: hypothetical protein DRJ38_04545 [Thermoprotei archaeon]